jgi:uncharacterized protein YigA (DUF484 family)
MRERAVPTAMHFWPARNRLMPQPLGVVGIVSPWNYPFQLALAPVTAALAAGNRVLIKPSELTPRFSSLLSALVARHFDATEVVMLLFEAGAASGKERHVRHVAANDQNLIGFETLLSSARPRCGQIRDSQREFLFGVEAGSVGSVALVPLISDVPLGLLALGSHDRERFHPGMSTDFLAQLGELISDALARD